jgi:hypothetical protein
VIAQNLHQQIDTESITQIRLTSIIDHIKGNDVIDINDAYATTKSGKKRMIESTVGWFLLVEFDDSSTEWIPLKRLKETNPIEVSEYAVANNLSDEVTFRYWIPFVLKKREQIISSIKRRVLKTKVKFGIDIPNSMAAVRRIDAENGNDVWDTATCKEIMNIKVAFEFLSEGDPIPEGWTRSSGHMIWDLRLHFTRKARWVKDGHRTPDPEWSTFAGVVSRESVRIALTYAVFNNIPVMAGDIMNVYLQAPASEKHYIVCGKEFGPEYEGRIELIIRALYGGKSAGFDF